MLLICGGYYEKYIIKKNKKYNINPVSHDGIVGMRL